MRHDHAVGPALGAKPRTEDIDVAGLTHPGLVRRSNQDHFLVCSLHKYARVHATSLPPYAIQREGDGWMAFFGMVADGVGGSAGGEIASRAAIEAVPAYVNDALDCFSYHDPTNEAAFITQLEAAAHQSHQAVLARARENPTLAGMATTLTLMMVVWPMCYLLQVGDSRGYRLVGGRLQQLTHDQTVAQQLIDYGTDAEEVRLSPMANVLTSAIGSKNRPVVSRFRLTHDDVLLLCSDGLTRHVTDATIERRLRETTTAEQGCRALIQDALDDGGTDNVTVVVARTVRKPERP